MCTGKEYEQQTYQTHLRYCITLALFFIAVLGSNIELLAQSLEVKIPHIQSMNIEMGESVPIPGTKSASVLQFEDGRIAVGQGKEVGWSFDRGYTWKPGPEGPFDKTSIDLGNGEIICIRRGTQRRVDNKFTLRVQRSEVAIQKGAYGDFLQTAE